MTIAAFLTRSGCHAGSASFDRQRRTGTPGSSTSTSSRLLDSVSAECAPRRALAIGSTAISSTDGSATRSAQRQDGLRRPRRHSLRARPRRRCRRFVAETPPPRRRPPRPTTRSRPSPEVWTAQQLALFLARPVTFAFTQLCISPLRPACGAARSAVFVGPTGTDRLIAYRSGGSPSEASVAEASRSRRKRRRVDACIDLDSTTETILDLLEPASMIGRITDDARRTDVHQRALAIPSIRSDSRSSSIDRSVSLVSLGSVSTICATPHASLLVAVGSTDQGRLRAPRPRSPGLHDGDLPAPPAWHGRQCRERFARSTPTPTPRFDRRLPIFDHSTPGHAAPDRSTLGQTPSIDDVHAPERRRPGNAVFPGLPNGGGGRI